MTLAFIIDRERKVTGHVNWEQGRIAGKGTALIRFRQSQISLDGDKQNPDLRIRAISKIDDTEIFISVDGRLNNPRIFLSSTPPKDQEILLVMLGTGKRWKGTEEAFRRGELSFDLAKDVFDYFVFAESRNRIWQRMGINDVSVKYDDNTKGIKLNKKVTNKLDATYSVEKKVSDAQEETTQRVGGIYKMTDKVSVEAEKELKSPELKPENKLLLKYQKNF